MANSMGMQFWRDNAGTPERIADIRAYGTLEHTADTSENTLVDAVKNIKTFGKGQITLGEFEVTLDWKDRASASAAYKALLDDFENSQADGEYYLRLPERLGKVEITLGGPITSLGQELPSDTHCSRKIKITLNSISEGVWV